MGNSNEQQALTDTLLHLTYSSILFDIKHCYYFHSSVLKMRYSPCKHEDEERSRDRIGPPFLKESFKGICLGDLMLTSSKVYFYGLNYGGGRFHTQCRKFESFKHRGRGKFALSNFILPCRVVDKVCCLLTFIVCIFF